VLQHGVSGNAKASATVRSNTATSCFGIPMTLEDAPTAILKRLVVVLGTVAAANAAVCVGL